MGYVESNVRMGIIPDAQEGENEPFGRFTVKAQE